MCDIAKDFALVVSNLTTASVTDEHFGFSLSPTFVGLVVTNHLTGGVLHS